MSQASDALRPSCVFVFLALLVSPALSAGGHGVPERGMGVDRWNDGWEFLYGMGATRSQMVTDNQAIEVEGHGAHFSTAVGYCDLQAYCLEVGSLVSFNYYDEMEVDYLDQEFDLDLWMWETALYLAVRARVPGTRPQGHFDPWIKLLSGYGAGVGYPTWSSLPGHDEILDMRVQQEGPLFGVSFINLFNNERPGRLWFVEFSGIMQMYWNSWLVKEGGILPEITQTSKTNGNPYSLLLSATLGFRVF